MRNPNRTAGLSGLAGLAVLAFLAGPGALRAAEVSARGFAPLPGEAGLFGVHVARPLPHLGFVSGLSLDYAADELVGETGVGDPVRLVGHRLTAEIALGMGLFERFDLLVSLPLVLDQRGSSPAAAAGGFPADRSSGLGDLRLLPRVTILAPDGAGFGLSFVAEVTAPTGRADHFMTAGSVTFTPRVVADWRFAGGALVALNAGYLLREALRLPGLTVDDSVLVALGGEVPLGVAGISAIASLDASFTVIDPEDGARSHPFTLHAGLRWRGPAGVSAVLGGGLGLNSGYGAPEARAVLALAWGPDDRDSLAVSGASELEGEPDHDVSASAPAPPELALVAPESPEFGAAFDAAAADDPDVDADGLPAAIDKCPTEAEDPDGFEDGDGCPDPDNDRDGVPDPADRCPDAAEVVNGVDDADGCPDEGQGAVIVGAKGLQLDQRVRFETGSDVLTVGSEALLRQVATVLRAHWEVRRVRVEGHTDGRGDREMNVDLSERRARRVLAFLVSEGVEPWRLEAKGYGPTVPVAPNRTQQGRARNRRVEFTILERLEAVESDGSRDSGGEERP